MNENHDQAQARRLVELTRAAAKGVATTSAMLAGAPDDDVRALLALAITAYGRGISTAATIVAVGGESDLATALELAAMPYEAGAGPSVENAKGELAESVRMVMSVLDKLAEQTKTSAAAGAQSVKGE